MIRRERSGLVVECISQFIKLPFVFMTIVLSIFEWPLKASFTVVHCILDGIWLSVFCLLSLRCLGFFVLSPGHTHILFVWLGTGPVKQI